MTAKAPMGNARPFRMIAGVSTLSDLADGAGANWGYPGAGYGGKQYFVNNITGASTNDGSDWQHAFAQVDEAIAASEAYRVLPSGTTGDYIRNQIFIQGTGTAYEVVAVATVNMTDFIGIGAFAWGNGTGVAQISGLGAAHAFALSATARGNNFYNIRFDGSGAYNAFDCANLLRTTFVDCFFGGDAITNSSLTTGFYTDGDCGGLLFKHCFFGSDWAELTTGINFAGASVGMTEIRDCIFVGGTGIHIGSGNLDNQTVIRDNVMQCTAHGILTENGGAGYDRSIIVNNYIISADAIHRAGGGDTNSGDDASIFNHVNNGGTAAEEHTYTV